MIKHRNKWYGVLVVLLAIGLCQTGYATTLGGAGSNEKKDTQSSSKMMREQTYRKVQNAQELLTNGKYAESLKVLDEVLPSTEGRDYERAVVLQTIAYVYISRASDSKNKDSAQNKSDYNKAGDYLQQAVSLNALPAAAQLQSLRALAQVYTLLEEYQKAITVLDRYLKNAEKPDPEVYFMVAAAYAYQEKYAQAVPYAKQAVEKADTPHEGWYKLWLATEASLEHYASAADILERMVGLWPEKGEYWQQLATMYLQLNEDKKALSTLALAYKKGLLTKEKDFLNLAQLYMLQNAPWEAAKVVSAGIDKGIVEKNKKNLEREANAWFLAKEFQKAIDTYDQAAQYADDGEFYLREAQIYQQMANWKGVLSATKKALDKGGLKKPGDAYILRGMAAVDGKKYDAALQAFREARKYDGTKKNAEQWIQYVHNNLASGN